MNAWDILVAACVVLAVAGAFLYLRRARRRSKCATCPYAGDCTKPKRLKTD